MPVSRESQRNAKVEAAKKAAAVTKRLYGPNGVKRGKQADRAMTVADVLKRLRDRMPAC